MKSYIILLVKNMTKEKTILKITLSGLLLSLGYVLPFLTGNIPEIGSMLSPMHIPVFICGLLCGWKYGLGIGIILPLLRGVTIGMPILYPAALAMSLELGTYGLVCGFIKNRNQIINIYIVMIISMIFGRLIWGIVRYLMTIFDQTLSFSLEIFLSSAVLSAWPGIILHLLIIPPIIIGLNKLSFIKDLD